MLFTNLGRIVVFLALVIGVWYVAGGLISRPERWHLNKPHWRISSHEQFFKVHNSAKHDVAAHR